MVHFNIMKKIRLTNCRKYVLVDDEDFKNLNKHKWYEDSDGYAVRGIRPSPRGKQTLEKMHRVIINAKPKSIVDHINRKKLDNQKNNLRVVSALENCYNRSPSKKKKHSKFKGICFVPKIGKWKAMIGFNKVRKLVGYFLKEIDAAKAYDAAARLYHGKFAYQNFKD